MSYNFGYWVLLPGGIICSTGRGIAVRTALGRGEQFATGAERDAWRQIAKERRVAEILTRPVARMAHRIRRIIAQMGSP
jgi:hypothetical protein